MSGVLTNIPPPSDVADWLAWLGLALLLVALLLILRWLYAMSLIRKCNRRETWLPVCDDSGNVIGRVARSVSQESPGLYQHPLVRILVWCNGRVFLRTRDAESGFEQGLVDHPFELMLKFGEDIDAQIQQVKRTYFSEGTQSRFLLKYKHENTDGIWQVFLYMLIVQNERDLSKLCKEGGKTWTLQQLRENKGKHYFSSIFESEIQFFSTLLGPLSHG